MDARKEKEERKKRCPDSPFIRVNALKNKKVKGGRGNRSFDFRLDTVKLTVTHPSNFPIMNIPFQYSSFQTSELTSTPHT